MNSVSSEYRQHPLIVYIDSITEHYFKHTYDTIETLTQLDIILIQP